MPFAISCGLADPFTIPMVMSDYLLKGIRDGKLATYPWACMVNVKHPRLPFAHSILRQVRLSELQAGLSTMRKNCVLLYAFNCHHAHVQT